jgi:hypothetical protein
MIIGSLVWNTMHIMRVFGLALHDSTARGIRGGWCPDLLLSLVRHDVTFVFVFKKDEILPSTVITK